MLVGGVWPKAILSRFFNFGILLLACSLIWSASQELKHNLINMSPNRWEQSNCICNKHSLILCFLLMLNYYKQVLNRLCMILQTGHMTSNIREIHITIMFPSLWLLYRKQQRLIIHINNCNQTTILYFGLSWLQSLFNPVYICNGLFTYKFRSSLDYW